MEPMGKEYRVCRALYLLRLLGPKTKLCKVFELFLSLRDRVYLKKPSYFTG